MAETFRKIRPAEYLSRFLTKQIRPDGRGLDSFRKTLLTSGPVSTADGSALVRLGRTSVMCGIKAEYANPSLDPFRADAPNEGWIVPNVTMSAMCAARFRTGPPSDESKALSHFLDSIVKTSRMVDLKDLCIEPGKLCWVLHVDIYCLDCDGNVADACVLAMVTALRNFLLPKLIESDDGGLPVALEGKENASPLKLYCMPISVSFSYFQGSVLADPTDEEEALSDSSLTIVMDERHKMQGVFKPSVASRSSKGERGAGMSRDQLRAAAETAEVRVDDVLRLIEQACTKS